MLQSSYLDIVCKHLSMYKYVPIKSCSASLKSFWDSYIVSSIPYLFHYGPRLLTNLLWILIIKTMMLKILSLFCSRFWSLTSDSFTLYILRNNVGICTTSVRLSLGVLCRFESELFIGRRVYICLIVESIQKYITNRI